MKIPIVKGFPEIFSLGMPPATDRLFRDNPVKRRKNDEKKTQFEKANFGWSQSDRG